jgi:Xaa-Pro dipeptidase
MTNQQIDVAVFVPGSNLRYLSGIGFSTKLRLTCLIVPLHGTPAIVLPTMEAPRAQAQAQFPITIYGWDDDAAAQAVATAIADLGITGGTIAVEYVVMRVFELRAIETVLPDANIINADPLIAQLRMHKTADELAAMQRAITVAETSLAQTIAAIRPGMNELQVAASWEKAIRAAGSVPSFDLAVGAG